MYYFREVYTCIVLIIADGTTSAFLSIVEVICFLAESGLWFQISFFVLRLQTPYVATGIEDVLSMKEESMSLKFELICFSHLRWNFAYQRPQHLLSRCVMERRVFFIEEPVFVDNAAYLAVNTPQPNLHIVVPHLSPDLFQEEVVALQQRLLDDLFVRYEINDYVLWYYTPMALAFTGHLEPLATVYDCMDEPSAFKEAPHLMGQREKELFVYADLVFTSAHSLREAKGYVHPRVYAFPSSVDSDKLLEQTSWDATWAAMNYLIEGVVADRQDWLPYSIVSTA